MPRAHASAAAEGERPRAGSAVTAAGVRPSRSDALLGWLTPPAGAWGYGLRIWIAMMLALYAAFWLQLESASSAAVCVAILAQPKRGQALSKAFYRIVGTFIGFLVSILFAALFGQDRVLMLIGFTTWLGLCVFFASYNQGMRAYGAVLSGYTVAIIAIAHIDAPLSVFASGVARVAAITLGIIAVTFVNDALGAPWVFPQVRDSLAGAHGSVRALMRQALQEGDPGPEAAAAALRRINATRADIPGVTGEFDDGPDRAAGARSAVAGLFGQVSAARSFALAAARDGAEASDLGRQVLAGLEGDRAAAEAVEAGLRAAVKPGTAPDTVLLHRRAADLLRDEAWIRDGLAALMEGRAPARDVTLPVHRDFPDAMRKAIRAMLAVAVSSALMILSGWPGTSTGLLQIAAFAGITAINPTPGAFAVGALIGTPLAALAAGIVLFFVLDGGQGFPLLAIAMAPVVFTACILSLGKRTGSLGFILLVFFPVLLAPSNPQSYDLQNFLDTAILFSLSGLVIYLSTRVLPATDARRRRWSLQTLRASLGEALTAEPVGAARRASLNGDRLAQFSALSTVSGPGHRAWLRHAFALAALDTAAAGAQAGLNRLVGVPGYDRPIQAARAALHDLNADALRAAGADLLAQGCDQADTVSAVVADLTTAAHVIVEEARVLRRLALRTPSVAEAGSAHGSATGIGSRGRP